MSKQAQPRHPTRSVFDSTRTVLELVRIPNVFTAGADVLAGFFFVGGGIDDVWTAVYLTLASMALYAGGVALNDVADARRDAAARPERPIPSGRITRRRATVLSIGLLATGVALASMVSPGSAAVAIGIVAAIVLYDVAVKTTPIAPALMGLCRALNVLLGVSALQGTWSAVVLLPVLGVWLYITSVTVFARTEASTSSRRRLEAGAGGVLLAVASLSALAIFLHPLHRGYLILVAGLLVVVAHKARIAIRSRQPQQVQDAVKTFIFGLVIFDSAVAWSVGGIAAGCVVASLLIPAMLLSRRFRPT